MKKEKVTQNQQFDKAKINMEKYSWNKCYNKVVLSRKNGIEIID